MRPLVVTDGEWVYVLGILVVRLDGFAQVFRCSQGRLSAGVIVNEESAICRARTAKSLSVEVQWFIGPQELSRCYVQDSPNRDCELTVRNDVLPDPARDEGEALVLATIHDNLRAVVMDSPEDSLAQVVALSLLIQLRHSLSFMEALQMERTLATAELPREQRGVRRRGDPDLEAAPLLVKRPLLPEQVVSRWFYEFLRRDARDVELRAALRREHYGVPSGIAWMFRLFNGLGFLISVLVLYYGTDRDSVDPFSMDFLGSSSSAHMLRFALQVCRVGVPFLWCSLGIEWFLSVASFIHMWVRLRDARNNPVLGNALMLASLENGLTQQLRVGLGRILEHRSLRENPRLSGLHAILTVLDIPITYLNSVTRSRSSELAQVVEAMTLPNNDLLSGSRLEQRGGESRQTVQGTTVRAVAALVSPGLAVFVTRYVQGIFEEKMKEAADPQVLGVFNTRFYDAVFGIMLLMFVVTVVFVVQIILRGLANISRECVTGLGSSARAFFSRAPAEEAVPPQRAALPPTGVVSATPHDGRIQEQDGETDNEAEATSTLAYGVGAFRS